VFKQGDVYYMLYSANDFRNKDYAVGYATSNSPFGPWDKENNSPFISRSIIGQPGTGHGDLFYDAQGNMQYVFLYPL
jgi:xylan 1,4-beta-xylosidase